MRSRGPPARNAAITACVRPSAATSARTAAYPPRPRLGKRQPRHPRVEHVDRSMPETDVSIQVADSAEGRDRVTVVHAGAATVVSRSTRWGWAASQRTGLITGGWPGDLRRVAAGEATE